MHENKFLKRKVTTANLEKILGFRMFTFCASLFIYLKTIYVYIKLTTEQTLAYHLNTSLPISHFS